jgi:hypothetical protein
VPADNVHRAAVYDDVLNQTESLDRLLEASHRGWIDPARIVGRGLQIADRDHFASDYRRHAHTLAIESNFTRFHRGAPSLGAG